MHASLRRHTAAALGAALLATSSLVIVTAPSLAQDTSVTVGGAPMLRSKNSQGEWSEPANNAINSSS